MNTYVVPVSAEGCAWIDKVAARSLQEAKDKIIESYVNLWDLDFPGDWAEFVEILKNEDVVIGNVLDIEAL